MNQTQWQALNAMGISSWKMLETGEIAYSQRNSQTATKPSYLILLNQIDLYENRAFFHAILNGLNWQISNLRIFYHADDLRKINLEDFKLLWCAGEQNYLTENLPVIKSHSLKDLQNPQNKMHFWQKIKEYRHA